MRVSVVTVWSLEGSTLSLTWPPAAVKSSTKRIFWDQLKCLDNAFAMNSSLHHMKCEESEVEEIQSTRKYLETKKCMRKSREVSGSLYTKDVATVGSQRRKVTGSMRMVEETRCAEEEWSIHAMAVVPREWPMNTAEGW